ncbi:XRE family transcriptional regulator [Actinomadura spongiicola]|uniref:XRE family transcriptional regulator n=1 Tax=Actinomadura spongiicola TaxID=2303421 RepID=A0A372G7V7_9ACTN|nr:XRE family transcriptional regulator [Actinomadura spongiicola]
MERPEWAARIQTERESRGWSKPQMARALFTSCGVPPTRQQVDSLARQIRKYENGEHLPRDWTRAYATVLGHEEDDLFAAASGPNHDEERRRLLACLSLLGVETASRAEPLEPIRQALARALPAGLQGHLVQDWEEIAFEHGHAFLTTPPDKLLPDLAADLVALLNSLAAAAGTAREDLCGPAGKLAALMAMTVSTLGERRHARDWWKTARHAADASKNRDLRVWVRGYEAMNALYSARPPLLVLRLAQHAVDIAGDHTGAAVLEAMAARAQALSMMDGRAEEAAAAVRDLEGRWERLPAAAPDDRLATGAWPETALHHTAAYTYTHTGDTDLAERARSQALSRYPTSMRRQRAQIELLRATGMVRVGDVAAGVELAGRTVEGLAAAQRTATIQHGARLVLDAVPAADLARPGVRDYRATFAPTAEEEG